MGFADNNFNLFVEVIGNRTGISLNEKNINDKMEDFEITSIQYISIVVDLESLFDINFDDEKLTMAEFNSFSDLYEYVISCIK